MPQARVVKRKASTRIDFPLSKTEMVLEVVSLTCIVISLAIVGITPTDISLQSAIIPITITLVYAALRLARRYPRSFSWLSGMEKDRAGEFQTTREMLAWLRTEIVWTLLCLQGILALYGTVQDSMAQIAMIIVFGILWLIINGTLAFLIMRISRLH